MTPGAMADRRRIADASQFSTPRHEAINMSHFQMGRGAHAACRTVIAIVTPFLPLARLVERMRRP
jgi:hypothetical protein